MTADSVCSPLSHCSSTIIAGPSYSLPSAHLAANLASTLSLSCSFISLSSSLVVSNLAFTWLNGFSGLRSNSFLIRSSLCFFLRPWCSSSTSGMRRASYAAYAALNLRSGCLSIFSDGLAEVSERASRALSIPVALRAGLAFEVEEEGSSSREERSRPLVFLVAVLLFLGVGRASFSSAARRASFSAFLRAASCFLASASSLRVVR